VLEAVLDREPVPLRRRCPAAPVDLETIVLKAMAKEPASRYASATELADDLGRFLDDRPVRARRPSVAQRAGKWAKRHRGLVAGGAVAGVLLLGALATGTILVTQEQDRTESALVAARRERRAADDARDHARARGLVNASVHARETDPMLALLLAREATSIAETPEALAALRDALAGALERVRIPGDFAGLDSAVLSPKGDRILTLPAASLARLWDLSGRPVAFFRGGVQHAHASFSPDGSLVVGAHGEREARIWNADGTERVSLVGHAARVVETAFSPAGDRVLTVAEDSTARLWSLDGAPLGVLRVEGAMVRQAAFLPGGDRVLVVATDGRAHLFDANATEVLAIGETGSASAPFAAISPGGDRLVLGTGDAVASVFDLEGRRLAVLRGHEGSIRAAAFDATGARIATASLDRTARVWTAAGALVAVCRGHSEAVSSVAFSPAGTSLVTASADRTARVFDVRGSELAVLRGHEQAVTSAVFSRDGRQVLTASLDRTARVWDVVPDEPVALAAAEERPTAVALAPDGEIVVGTALGALEAVRGDGSEARPLPAQRAAVIGLQPSSDGARWLVTSADGAVAVIGRDGSPRAVVRPASGGLVAAALAPGGARAVVADFDGSARVWVEGRDALAPLDRSDPLLAATFVGDATVVTAGVEGLVRLSGVDGATIAVLRGHRLPVRVVRASTGRPSFATGSDDGVVRIWDGRGAEVATLRGHDGPILDLRFRPDGRALVTTADDRIPRVWSDDGRLLARLRGHAAPVHHVEVSAEGDRIVTSSEDGTARVWDFDGRLLDVVRVASGPVSYAALTPDGSRLVTLGPASGCLLWRARLDDLRRLADARALRDFTRAEREEHRDLLGPENDAALRAHDLVDAMLREHVLASVVRDRLRVERGVPEDVRAAAVRIAAARTDDPDRLNREAWSIVRTGTREPEEYERAVRISQALVRLSPDFWPWLNTLGTAQYRARAYDDAIRTLARAEEARAKAGKGPLAEDLAVLAMVHHRRGDAEEAKRVLARLHALMDDPVVARDASAAAFRAEADALLTSR
jgi:WD40 repeat protein